jgi:hypothetical protein
VECGIYDLGPFASQSVGFENVKDGFLEDIILPMFEAHYSKLLKQSIDLNLLPESQASKGIVQAIWALYLRSPRVRQTNSLIAQENDAEIDDQRRQFLNNFGVVTSKAIIKLLPATLVHAKSLFLNAVGTSRFLTTDNPSIPCIYDEHTQVIQPCNQLVLQRSVILADKWPSEAPGFRKDVTPFIRTSGGLRR